MKILFINPLIRENQLPVDFPTGLGIIAAIALKKGFDVLIYDENAFRPSWAELRRDLRNFDKIDIVALGGLITYYKHVKKLVPCLREMFPKATIVLGGGITIDPQVIFENIPDVDFCVHGEGEHTFIELCEAILRNEKDYSFVKGISYIDTDRKIITTESRPIEINLDIFPMPAYELFPSEIYFRNMVYKVGGYVKSCATLLWSRGCPNQCSFCWRMMGRTVRFRSIDLVMDEIEFLRSKYNVDSYVFYDECINANKSRTIEFANKLIKKKFTAPWFSHARVTNFDEELAFLLKRSGCFALNFGVESADQNMLAAMKKNATPEQAVRAISIAHRAGINQICTFIIGMPGENIDSINKTLTWIKKYKPSFSYFFYATPYPGSELYNMPDVQKRIIDRYATKDEFFSNLGDADKLIINLTDFSDKDLIKTRENAAQTIRGTIFRRIIRLLSQPYRWKPVFFSLIKKLSGR